MIPILKLSNGLYGGMIINSGEEDLAALHAAWTTPKQMVFNATHDTCPTCKGRGEVRRKNGKVVCRQCLGTGSIDCA